MSVRHCQLAGSELASRARQGDSLSADMVARIVVPAAPTWGRLSETNRARGRSRRRSPPACWPIRESSTESRDWMAWTSFRSNSSTGHCTPREPTTVSAARKFAVQSSLASQIRGIVDCTANSCEPQKAAPNESYLPPTLPSPTASGAPRRGMLSLADPPARASRSRRRSSASVLGVNRTTRTRVEAATTTTPM